MLFMKKFEDLQIAMCKLEDKKMSTCGTILKSNGLKAVTVRYQKFARTIKYTLYVDVINRSGHYACALDWSMTIQK